MKDKRRFFERFTLALGCAMLSVGSVMGAYITDRHLVMTQADSASEVAYNSLAGSVWESQLHTFDPTHFPYAWGGRRGGVVITRGTFFWSNQSVAYGRTYPFYGISFADDYSQLWLYRNEDLDSDVKFVIPYSEFNTYMLTLTFSVDSLTLIKEGVPASDQDTLVREMQQGLYDNFDLVIPPDNYDGVLSLDDAKREITSLCFFDLFDNITASTSRRYLIHSDLRSNIYHGSNGFDIPEGTWWSVYPYRIEFYYQPTVGNFVVTDAWFYTSVGAVNSMHHSLPFCYDFYHGTGTGFFMRSWARAFAPVVVSGSLNSSSYGVDGYTMAGNYDISASNWALDSAGMKTFFENYYLPDYFTQTDPVYYQGRALVINRPEYNNNLWNSAYNEGWYVGHRVGYNEGVNSVNEETTAVVTLFGSIVNVPITALNGLTSLTIWNVPIISILMTFLFVAIIAFLVKRFI